MKSIHEQCPSTLSMNIGPNSDCKQCTESKWVGCTVRTPKAQAARTPLAGCRVVAHWAWYRGTWTPCYRSIRLCRRAHARTPCRFVSHPPPYRDTKNESRHNSLSRALRSVSRALHALLQRSCAVSQGAGRRIAARVTRCVTTRGCPPVTIQNFVS